MGRASQPAIASRLLAQFGPEVPSPATPAQIPAANEILNEAGSRGDDWLDAGNYRNRRDVRIVLLRASGEDDGRAGLQIRQSNCGQAVQKLAEIGGLRACAPSPGSCRRGRALPVRN